MTTAKENLEAFKNQIKRYKPITPWDALEVGAAYHIPPIKTLSRRDVIILEKTADTLKYKRIDDTEKKEGNMAKTSVYAKVMIKRKKY